MRYRYAIPLFLALTIGIVADLGVRVHHLSSGPVMASQNANNGKAQYQEAAARPEKATAQDHGASLDTGLLPAEREKDSPAQFISEGAGSATKTTAFLEGSSPSPLDPKEMASSSPDPKDMKELIVEDAPVTAPSNADFGQNGANHGIPLPIEGGKVPTAPVAVPEPQAWIVILIAGFLGSVAGGRWRR